MIGRSDSQNVRNSNEDYRPSNSEPKCSEAGTTVSRCSDVPGKSNNTDFTKLPGKIRPRAHKPGELNGRKNGLTV